MRTSSPARTAPPDGEKTAAVPKHNEGELYFFIFFFACTMPVANHLHTMDG